MRHPRLRDSKRLVTNELYPINELPDDLVVRIGEYRTCVLVRSNDLLSYCLFEEDNHRFRTSDYIWEVNANGNLIGKEVLSGEPRFTWQPHGSQFTIHTTVPENAIKFTLRRPPCLMKEDILKSISFDSSWVNILR